MHGPQVSHDSFHLEPRNKSHEVQPMSPDIPDSTEISSFFIQNPPVEVAGIQEPVLDIAALDMKYLADAAATNHGASLETERIEPHVVIDCGDQLRVPLGRHDERGRFGRGHCEWLFANDILPRLESGEYLAAVKAIRRSEMNRLDFHVGQQLVIVSISPLETKFVCSFLGFLERSSKDSLDVNSQPAQGLQMNGRDKASTYYSNRKFTHDSVNRFNLLIKHLIFLLIF